MALNTENKMNNYQLEIVAELKQRQKDVERNYKSARKEWERLKIQQNNLFETDPYSDELQDVTASLRATFEFMERLDAESMAIFGCYRAIEKYA